MHGYGNQSNEFDKLQKIPPQFRNLADLFQYGTSESEVITKNSDEANTIIAKIVYSKDKTQKNGGDKRNFCYFLEERNVNAKTK